jgi:hypothetical protein
VTPVTTFSAAFPNRVYEPERGSGPSRSRFAPMQWLRGHAWHGRRCPASSAFANLCRRLYLHKGGPAMSADSGQRVVPVCPDAGDLLRFECLCAVDRRDRMSRRVAGQNSSGASDLAGLDYSIWPG